MLDMRRGAACLALMLVFLLPQSSEAQSDHAAEMARVRAQLDSVVPQYARWKTADSIWQQAQYRRYYKRKPIVIDSMDFGPFHIVGDRKSIRSSAADAGAAWKELEPLFKGVDAPPRSMTIIVGRRGVRDSLAARIRPENAVIDLAPETPDLWQYGYERTMGLVLSRHLPASVRAWLEGEGIATTHVPSWVYRAIALPFPDSANPNQGPSPCVLGDMPNCRKMLGLDEGAKKYSDGILRASFITWLAKHAQPGAVSASTSDTSALIPALERIGGAPIDTLIAGWRDDLIAQRPRQMAGTAGLPISVLIWVVVCAAIASRSTRWRLG